MIYTEADFDQLAWHDCHIWGVQFQVGDPGVGDWSSELAFDIDYIAEWLCGISSPSKFRVAPASLVFHGVTDPRIDVDWGSAGYQVALHPLCIHEIQRVEHRDQKVFLDRRYFRWKILLNWPDGGEIEFGAVGFTLTLRREPVLITEQHFSWHERNEGPSPEGGGELEFD